MKPKVIDYGHGLIVVQMPDGQSAFFKNGKILPAIVKRIK